MSDELKKLYEEIDKCRGCPPGTRELGWGSPEKILFIGQCPPARQQKFDKYFFDLIERVGIKDGDFFFTNIVKTPVDMNSIDRGLFSHCAQHVDDEIKLIKPRVIIGLGRHAASFIDAFNIKAEKLMHPSSLRYPNSKVTEAQWLARLSTLVGCDSEHHND